MSEQYLFPADNYVLIAKVSKAHGLKGEVKIFPLSDHAGHFKDYSRVALVATNGRMTELLNLVHARQQGKRIILKLDTIDTKDEADLTAGMGVLLPKEDLPEAKETEIYLHQLAGLLVKTVGRDEIIGTVEDTFHNGAHEILVVRSDDREFLIPLIDEFIVEYNDREILIDPPAGLLELSGDSGVQEKS
jgi:16S rRNA processing protein RimM